MISASYLSFSIRRRLTIRVISLFRVRVRVRVRVRLRLRVRVRVRAHTYKNRCMWA